MNLIFTFTLLIYVAENLVLCQKNTDSRLHKRGDLLFVQSIFRHGERTPLQFYTNDPWKDGKYWDDDAGQLTKVGKQQQFELGLYIRERYAAFLNATYLENDIYVQSSDIDRTLMSAEAFLAGMYRPQTPTDIWSIKLPWQPIPVHTTPVKEDNLIVAYSACDAYSNSYDACMNSEPIKEFERKHKDLYDYLSLHSGDTIGRMKDAVSIWDTLMIEGRQNKTLPKWSEKISPGGDLYDSLNEVLLKYFTVDTSTPYLAKIKGGFILKDILDRFTNKTKSILDPDRRFWVYSGHDTTICRTLNTLGLLESLAPFSACILFEMRNYDGRPHIEIFLKNSTTEAVPLYVPNCGWSCPLDDFYVLYDDVLPKESFEDECNAEESERSSAGEENASNLIMQVVGLSVLLLTQQLLFAKMQPGHS